MLDADAIAIACLLSWAAAAMVGVALEIFFCARRGEWPPAPMILCTLAWPLVAVTLTILGVGYALHWLGRQFPTRA